MLVNLKKLKTRNKNRLARGVYELRGWWEFSFDHYLEHHGVDFIDTYDMYKNNNDTIPYYGVCDNYSQILEQYPDLINSKNKYVIGLTKVRKEDQPKWGGWRWHKWGEYIGNQSPAYEYLYDEKEIEQVYCFNVYQVK